jgi:hypothetical protein
VPIATSSRGLGRRLLRSSLLEALAYPHDVDRYVELASCSAKSPSQTHDAFLASSSEPWLIPNVEELPRIDPRFAQGPNLNDDFLPYLRDERLARSRR